MQIQLYQFLLLLQMLCMVLELEQLQMEERHDKLLLLEQIQCMEEIRLEQLHHLIQ
jgi:hypothetical protein